MTFPICTAARWNFICDFFLNTLFSVNRLPSFSIPLKKNLIRRFENNIKLLCIYIYAKKSFSQCLKNIFYFTFSYLYPFRSWIKWNLLVIEHTPGAVYNDRCIHYCLLQYKSAWRKSMFCSPDKSTMGTLYIYSAIHTILWISTCRKLINSDQLFNIIKLFMSSRSLRL